MQQIKRRKKIKSRSVRGSKRILKDSLRQLLGNELACQPTQNNSNNFLFLKDALNFQVLIN